MDVIVDYMSQVLLHEECPLHCVSFEFSNHIVNVIDCCYVVVKI